MKAESLRAALQTLHEEQARVPALVRAQAVGDELEILGELLGRLVRE